MTDCSKGQTCYFPVVTASSSLHNLNSEVFEYSGVQPQKTVCVGGGADSTEGIVMPPGESDP